MTKKKVSIGTAAVLTTGTILYLAFKSKHYYEHFRGWKKERLEDSYYKSRTETDIAWG